MVYHRAAWLLPAWLVFSLFVSCAEDTHSVTEAQVFNNPKEEQKAEEPCCGETPPPPPPEEVVTVDFVQVCRYATRLYYVALTHPTLFVILNNAIAWEVALSPGSPASVMVPKSVSTGQFRVCEAGHPPPISAGGSEGKHTSGQDRRGGATQSQYCLDPVSGVVSQVPGSDGVIKLDIHYAIVSQVPAAQCDKTLSSPLVLDVAGNGVELTAPNRKFDLVPGGAAERMSWVQGDDAFLALDRNGNQKIDDGGELFGNGTRMPDGTYAVDGFAALAQYDSNRDRKINAADTTFESLRLLKGDDTLVKLSAANIVSIGLSARSIYQQDEWDNVAMLLGVFSVRNGPKLQIRNIFDVWFAISNN